MDDIGWMARAIARVGRGGREVHDGIRAEGHVDTRADHVTVAVGAEVALRAEVIRGPRAVGYGGLGLRKGFDRAIVGVIDMGDKERRGGKDVAQTHAFSEHAARDDAAAGDDQHGLEFMLELLDEMIN